MIDVAIAPTTAAAMGFYLRVGLAEIANQFGENQRFKHPAVLAAWLQGCAVIHAGAKLGDELGNAIDDGLDDLGMRVGLPLADIARDLDPL